MPLRMRPRRRLISLSPTLSFDVAVQTSFHSVPTSSLDAAAQTLPHSTLSQVVSTQVGSRPASSFSLDVTVQTPIRSTVSHDTSTQFILTELFIGCTFSNDPFDRQRSSSAQGDIGSVSLPPLPDIATTCTLSSSSLDNDDHVRTLAPRVLLQPPPGLEQFAPPPGLAIDAHLCALHMAYLLKRHLLRPRLRSAISAHAPTASCLYHPCGNTSCAISYYRQEKCLYCLWREPTILSIQILVQGLALFLNREPSFFLWSTLVNPNLLGTVILVQPTVTLCTINFAFPSFNGIQAQRAETLLTLSLLPVVSFMQLFFKKPVITSRTSLSSSLCALAIRTLLSCSTKTPSNLTLQFSHTRLTPQAKVRGEWSCSFVRGLLRRPSLSGSPTVTFCSVHIHNVVAKKRDASTEVLQRLYGYMREHNVDFISGDFNMSAFSTVGDVFYRC